MGEGTPKPPLARRVPGAARSGPPEPPGKVLPDAVIARMQAAVDAAHGVEGQPEAATGPFDREPSEPDAPDHLAEPYGTADPDLSASFADQAWWEETVRGMARPRNRRDGPHRKPLRSPGSPEYLTGPIPVVSLQRPAQAAAEPVGSEPIGRRRRGRLMVGAAVLVTVLVAGGVVALVLPSRHHRSAAAWNEAAILAASDRA